MAKKQKSRKHHASSPKERTLPVKVKPLARHEFKSEKDIAMDFAMKAHQKFDRIIKASVLFGSQARNQGSPGSDIDLIFVVDDASIIWDIELVSWYREEMAKLAATDAYGKELHINTIKLTTFWKDLMMGDPVIINILRYGEVLVDYGGFFNPIKSLLLQGKIHSTPEAVYAALQRAPQHLARSKASEMGAIEGVYWTMVDAAQAALMMAGKVPPSPEHIPEMLNQHFVEQGMLKADLPRALKEIYALHKQISRGEAPHIKGADIDQWQAIAERFLSEITRVIELMIDIQKEK